jgi:hypothetical protein
MFSGYKEVNIGKLFAGVVFIRSASGGPESIVNFKGISKNCFFFVGLHF